MNPFYRNKGIYGLRLRESDCYIIRRCLEDKQDWNTENLNEARLNLIKRIKEVEQRYEKLRGVEK